MTSAIALDSIGVLTSHSPCGCRRCAGWYCSCEALHKYGGLALTGRWPATHGGMTTALAYAKYDVRVRRNIAGHCAALVTVLAGSMDLACEGLH